MYDYTMLESEDELIKEGDSKLKHLDVERSNDDSKNGGWPNEGEIEFKNSTMRYRETLEPSIKNLSFKVQSKMKVGIVGRTGAGKSSILQALFRLCELSEGDIIIDGQNIKDLGLHILRQNIAFIPQQPFLLKGTIRENLDPFEQ